MPFLRDAVKEERYAVQLPGLYVRKCLCQDNCKCPPGQPGSHYTAHRMIKDAVSGADSVLVECLDGPYKGIWLTWGVVPFAMRYELAEGGKDAGED